ncbi:hypothetical protein ACQEVY_25535 [Streptomyces sp. CA-288835]|uniref:hypothetical protein n=1 Tax=Streptomyces sp. CA-288835 TaxID=3240069 RepID=UPI003D90ECF3
MAEAAKTTVSKTIERVEKVPAITLTVSIEEAETLMAVGAKIGGDPEHSPRKHYAAVTEALRDAGVRDYMVGGEHPFKYLGSGALFFSNKKSSVFPF